MYLKITKQTTTLGRDDFHKWEYDATKIIIETLRGTKVPYAAKLNQTIELIDNGIIVCTLAALTEASPELLYAMYTEQTGKNATYEKKGIAIEYADYLRWLKRQQKGREY